MKKKHVDDNEMEHIMADKDMMKKMMMEVGSQMGINMSARSEEDMDMMCMKMKMKVMKVIKKSDTARRRWPQTSSHE